MLRLGVLTCFLSVATLTANGLDLYVEAAREQWQVPAVSIGIYHQAQVQKIAAYGEAEQDTLYAIGDVERGMMAALAALWVERGVCSWDTPVQHVLADLRLHDPYVARALTLEDLFSQRCGFPQDDPFSKTLLMRQTLRQRLDGLRHLTLDSFRYQHSNESHSAVIAEAWLRSQGGLPYSQLLRQLVLLPLGMQQPEAFPAMTVGDLLLWVECLLGKTRPGGRTLLSSQSVETLLRPRIPLPVDSALAAPTEICAFGLGWRLQDYRGRLLAWQTGRWGEDRCLLALIPQEDLGVVILARDSVHNGHGELPEALALRCIDHYIGYTGRDWSSERLRHWQPPRIASDRELLDGGLHPDVQAFTGAYQHPLYGRWDVRREGVELNIYDELGLTASLTHCYHNWFQLHWSEAGASERPIYVGFVRDQAGTISKLRVEPDIHWVRISEL